MLAQHTRLRRSAAQLLLVWLLALATGIVNACVIAPGTHTMPRQDVMAAHGMDHGTDTGHSSGCPDCPDEDSSGLASGSCAKFCLDESTSVPTAKQAFDPWPALGIAMVPTMGLSATDPGPRPVDRLDAAPPRAAPLDVAIAYLRLTL